MRKLRILAAIAGIVATGSIRAAGELEPVPDAAPQVVVLDIDGTLTPDNLWVFDARPDADKVLAAYVAKGYRIVYVTTRIPGFRSGLAHWLETHHFPAGPVHIAQSADERKMPAAFKARILREYTRKGWRLAYAYGDSCTDLLAYAAAGIPQERIFALKRRGAKDCEGGGFAACLDGWTAHLDYVERDVPGVP